MRLQLFITCFLFAVTSTAAPPKGAWTGTLGKQKVAACFDGSDATYYYVSKGVDIALTEGADGIWTEVAWDKDFSPGPSTGTWQLEEAQGKYLRGSWSSSDGRRTLPITLKLAGKPAADSKCPLPGYVAPRIDAVQRTPSKETSVSGLRLRMFKALHGAVVGLELLDDAAALSPVKQALEAGSLRDKAGDGAGSLSGSAEELRGFLQAYAPAPLRPTAAPRPGQGQCRGRWMPLAALP